MWQPPLTREFTMPTLNVKLSGTPSPHISSRVAAVLTVEIRLPHG